MDPAARAVQEALRRSVRLQPDLECSACPALAGPAVAIQRMRHVRWILPLLFIVVTSAAPTLPQQGASAISAVLKAATDRGDVPGVAVAVVNKDGLLYNEAAGNSRTLTHTPMAKDTIFNMASMTKPITSVAIMMLVDEGKLKLDDEVAKYLPKWKDPLVISKFNDADASYETRPAKRPITIRHLLTHTSGHRLRLRPARC